MRVITLYVGRCWYFINCMIRKREKERKKERKKSQPPGLIPVIAGNGNTRSTASAICYIYAPYIPVDCPTCPSPAPPAPLVQIPDAYTGSKMYNIYTYICYRLASYELLCHLCICIFTVPSQYPHYVNPKGNA